MKSGGSCFFELTEIKEKVSSVMPKAIKGSHFFEMFFLTRCETEAVIKKCLKLTMKVVKMISQTFTCKANKFKATNWLAPAKTNIDIKILICTGTPVVLDNIPKVIAMGMYPKAIGIPFLIPEKKFLTSTIDYAPPQIIQYII